MQRITIIVVVMLAALLSPHIVCSQDFVESPDGASSFSVPDTFNLMSDPSIQQDLALLDTQREKVWDLQAEFGGQMVEANTSLHDGTLTVEEYKTMLMARKVAYQSRLENLMLPHQLKRLTQISVQEHIKKSGTANAISSQLVADKLRITDGQKEELVRRSKEVKEKLRKEIARLRAEAKRELLSVLTTEQQEQLTELVGEKYTPRKEDFSKAREAFERYTANKKQRK